MSGVENPRRHSAMNPRLFALDLLLHDRRHALADRSLLAWKGLSPRVERNASQAHPIGGAILILLGIVTFIFFPALFKKIPGREVLSNPYAGTDSGGD